MYYVYITRSIQSPDKTYVGFSENLKNRIISHNNGKSPYTNKFKPWKLIFYCVFLDKKKALDFETYLKSGSGIVLKNKRLT